LNSHRGFTLIEVLMASLILTCGLLAAATVFSFIIRTNASNRQMAVATALLSEKMEEFRSLSFSDAIWAAGDGSETIVVAGDRFVRAWQIGVDTPRTVTVVISTDANALTRRPIELIRATTLVSPIF
jgi:prepilin-type N-terminal cleavage/methylation domain-containing protein